MLKRYMFFFFVLFFETFCSLVIFIGSFVVEKDFKKSYKENLDLKKYIFSFWHKEQEDLFLRGKKN